MYLYVNVDTHVYLVVYMYWCVYLCVVVHIPLCMCTCMRGLMCVIAWSLKGSLSVNTWRFCFEFPALVRPC